MLFIRMSILLGTIQIEYFHRILVINLSHVIMLWCVICDTAGELLQENWQKLIDLQRMLTGIDNIVVADRVRAVCLKYCILYRCS